MSSIFQSFQGKQALPLSQPIANSSQQQSGQCIRRKLSSLSLKIPMQPIISSSPAASLWAFRRSKIFSFMGHYAGNSIRNWWDWSLALILSRKFTFSKDLEMMNEEETAALGCHNKGSWRHVFYKLRSELRKLMGSDNVGLPQTFRYDSYNYSKNFDDTNRFSFGRRL